MNLTTYVIIGICFLAYIMILIHSYRERKSLEVIIKQKSSPILPELPIPIEVKPTQPIELSVPIKEEVKIGYSEYKYRPSFGFLSFIPMFITSIIVIGVTLPVFNQVISSVEAQSQSANLTGVSSTLVNAIPIMMIIPFILIISIAMRFFTGYRGIL